jgi:hypothetical protein
VDLCDLILEISSLNNGFTGDAFTGNDVTGITGFNGSGAFPSKFI